MTERVQVEPSEIKVGDLIEVEFRHQTYAPEEVTVYRGVATEVDRDHRVGTKNFRFGLSHRSAYSYYRLPKTAPEEPKGLGAVVEDREGDLWVRMTGGWFIEGDPDRSDWEDIVKYYGPVTVKHDGYTPDA